jgi:hypothetical protein
MLGRRAACQSHGASCYCCNDLYLSLISALALNFLWFWHARIILIRAFCISYLLISCIFSLLYLLKWCRLLQSITKLYRGGLVGDHERYNAATALLSKGLEEEPNWPQANYNFYGGGHGVEEIQTNKSQAAVSQMLLASPSSRRSCITTSLGGGSMLDFSNSTAPAPDQLKNHQSDNSSEVS